MKHSGKDGKLVSEAARLMGQMSWKAKLKRFGIRQLKQKLSAAGKAAKNSGRPRLPDDQVKPSALYQRERREKLKASRTTGKH